MRPGTLSVVLLLVLLTSLTCFSQQTDIRQFSAFYRLFLPQHAFIKSYPARIRWRLWRQHAQLADVGGDFSYNSGHSSLVPSDLNATTQAKLAPFLPFLPPGFVLKVPYNSSTYTYEAGPQFNYRRLKKVYLLRASSAGRSARELHGQAERPNNSNDCQRPSEREDVQL